MLYLQILINGIVAGSTYGLGALGFNVIYGTTRTFHIAYGSTVLVALYLATEIAVTGSAVYLALGVAALVALVIGALVYVAMYAPLERLGRSRTVVFVGSLGLALVLGSVIPWIFGAAPRTFSLPSLLSAWQIGSIRVSPIDVVAVGLAAVFSVAMWALLKWSRYGRHLRSITANPELGKVMGIQRSRILILTFALGSFVGFFGLATQALSSSVTPSLGLQFTLIAAIIVLAGGAGSLIGSYAIALGFGIVQQGLTLGVSANWATVIVFLVFVTFIVARPSGLVGTLSKRIL